MADSSSRPHAPAALLDKEPDELRGATCPMCHTRAPVTQHAIDAGGDWRCAVCGQHWDAARLAVVAAYSAWTVDRDRIGLQVTEGPDAPLHGDSPTDRPGGAA